MAETTPRRSSRLNPDQSEEKIREKKPLERFATHLTEGLEAARETLDQIHGADIPKETSDEEPWSYVEPWTSVVKRYGEALFIWVIVLLMLCLAYNVSQHGFSQTVSLKLDPLFMFPEIPMDAECSWRNGSMICRLQ